MKIDAWLGLPEAASSQELAGIGDRARMMEQDGYSGLLSAETSHDPFLPLTLAAQHTERIELMTAIAVGFARNPDGAGPHGMGPPSTVAGAVPARAGQPDPGPHSPSASRCPGRGQRPAWRR